jgi:hypothetical protein
MSRRIKEENAEWKKKVVHPIAEPDLKRAHPATGVHLQVEAAHLQDAVLNKNNKKRTTGVVLFYLRFKI